MRFLQGFRSAWIYSGSGSSHFLIADPDPGSDPCQKLKKITAEKISLLFFWGGGVIFALHDSDPAGEINADTCGFGFETLCFL